MTVELFNVEFEGIIGQLKAYILRISASIDDAEDIVQDTYIKALEKLNTFRGESSLKTWLFTIASNLLKEVYAFKVSEITTILNTTEAMVKYYLHTGRTKMINIFDGRCALINKEGVCHQCSELNGIFNPKQKTQEEVMNIEMAKEAEKGDKEQLFDLRMSILREIDPFKSKASDLQLHHLEHNRQVMEKYQQ